MVPLCPGKWVKLLSSTRAKSHREETKTQLENYILLINKSNDHENKMEGIMGNMNGRMENLEREVENLRNGQEGIPQ